MQAVLVQITPEPSPEEAEAIRTVLADTAAPDIGWAASALSEGVEQDEPEP